jgi:hypothetical protein
LGSASSPRTTRFPKSLPQPDPQSRGSSLLAPLDPEFLIEQAPPDHDTLAGEFGIDFISNPSDGQATIDADQVRSRTDQRQATEMTVAVAVLNRMLELGRSKSVRIA